MKTRVTFKTAAWMLGAAWLCVVTGPAAAVLKDVELVPLFTIAGEEVSQPADVFVDEENNEIYVVNSGNNRITVYDMDGFYRYSFPAPVESGGGPTSLVVNDHDEILIVVGNRIAVCDFRGSLLEYVQFDGLPPGEQVESTRIRLDGKGNYYLLGAQRVLAFDPEWRLRFIIDRSSLPATHRVNGKERPISKTQAFRIGDLWVDDDGYIYAVDFIASFVFVFNQDGRYVRTIGEPGGTFDTLSFPTGVAVDSQGRVLVVDSTSHGLLGYAPQGQLLFAVGGIGKAPGRFYFPKYVSTDHHGRIYVVEPALDRVQVLTVRAPS